MAFSRRHIPAVCAALLLSLDRASAQKRKSTKAEAAYQDTPKDIRMCATCTFFQPPNACAVVEGDVSPDGWCRLYAIAD